ncbi:hypothetical protein AAGS39_48130 [Flavobacterium sp. CGRL2]
MLKILIYLKKIILMEKQVVIFEVLKFLAVLLFLGSFLYCCQESKTYRQLSIRNLKREQDRVRRQIP